MKPAKDYETSREASPVGKPSNEVAQGLEQAVIELDERLAIRINTFESGSEVHLFNEVQFFRLHCSSAKDVYAQLTRRSDSLVLATIAFHEVEAGIFASPSKGTFGGLSACSDVGLEDLAAFLDAVFAHLRRAGGRLARVKCAPASGLVRETAVLANVMLRLGATVEAYDINYDLTVDDRAFIERVDTGNKKRIRKCRREQFLAKRIPQSRYAEAYEVVQSNRRRRGFPVTMSESELARMNTTFGDRVRYYAVFGDGAETTMLASAVCLLVTATTLYVAYWGDAAGVEAYSPVVLLAEAIYDECQQEGIKRLDVGIASVAGVPNLGLARFKQNLGFAESLKMSFALPLQDA